MVVAPRRLLGRPWKPLSDIGDAVSFALTRPARLSAEGDDPPAHSWLENWVIGLVSPLRDPSKLPQLAKP